jgi:hypothetical protein
LLVLSARTKRTQRAGTLLATLPEVLWEGCVAKDVFAKVVG